MATSDTQHHQTVTGVSGEEALSIPAASEGNSSLKFQILGRTLPLIGISMFFAVLVTWLSRPNTPKSCWSGSSHSG